MPYFKSCKKKLSYESEVSTFLDKQKVITLHLKK